MHIETFSQTSTLTSKFIELGMGANAIKVKLRQCPRAKRVRIRVGLRGVELVTPITACIQNAHQFLITEEEWVRDNLRKFKPSPDIGNEVLIFGIPFLITASAIPSKQIKIEDNKILVSEINTNTLRKIKEYLCSLVKEKIVLFADQISDKLGAKYTKISLRDPIYRWGSCSSRGRLSFSWRLVFAPFNIVESVVAHEMCHLLEMNHSDRFWNKLAQVDPNYQDAELWLQENGNLLHRYLPRA